jgi:hypothetical protein
VPSLALVEGHALTMELLEDLPPVLREDPDMQAIIYCQAKEHERLQQTMDRVAANLFPQTADELGMPWWEALLGLPVEPVGQTLAQRRETVMVYLSALRASGTGRWWVDTVSRLVGPGFEYEEHIAGDGGSPPAYTIRITLPFPPEGDRFRLLEGLLQQITDAHIDLVLSSTEGFHLDQSQLDQEPFGI